MANLKLVILTSKVKSNGECRVYVQLTHKRQVEQIPTSVNVKPENFEFGKVSKKDPNSGLKNIMLMEILTGFESKLLKLGEKQEYMTIKSIRSFLKSKSEIFCETDFFKYSRNRISELRDMGKDGTANPLSNAVNRFEEFIKKDRIDFNEITVNMLERFVSYYQKKGNKKNSIANYLTYIRSMFNDAIDEFNINPARPVIFNYPFRKIKIEREKTLNRNLSIEVIQMIRDMEAHTYKMEIAKDMFMLQIYTFGTNTKDLFYMKHENIVNGRMQFIRHKTGRFYNIKLEPEALTLIEKYKGEKYLMWFADNCYFERDMSYKKHSRKSEFQYANSESWNSMLNDKLKKIEDILELDLSSPLTTYFTRHSFASIMREIDISKDDISLCLGHKDPEQNLKVSGIYK